VSSISRTMAARLSPRAAAMAARPCQKAGSRAMEVRCPAMEKERFSMPGRGSGLFAEGVEAHHLFAAGFGRRLVRRGAFGGCVGRGLAILLRRRRRVELQAELHRRVEKALDGGKGDDQRLGLAVEAEADFEGAFADLEVPELVLDDDGHFLVVLAQ